MVVILVKRPATISITSGTGIPLISYRCLSSSPLRLRLGGEFDKGSCLGKSTTCERFCMTTGGVSSEVRFDLDGDFRKLGELTEEEVVEGELDAGPL